MIMKSKTTVYDHSSNKEVSLWKLDTDTSTVYHFDERKQKYDCFQFHTRYIVDHIRYTMLTYPERFQKLLDKGMLYSYLDELEIKAIDAVQRQVELWIPSSKEYQIAVEKGDIVKQAGLLNAWEAMAREIIYDCMIYV
ncbi:MAG: hypothetical protein ACI4I6_06665 [Hominimerdicola sp.]